MAPRARTPRIFVETRALQLDPHGPVVGNPPDARDAPTNHAHAARENPVVMLPVRPCAPSARAGRQRSLEALRFERPARGLARDGRESIEVAEHDGGPHRTVREVEHRAVLLQLTGDARVRVYVCVEDSEFARAEG